MTEVQSFPEESTQDSVTVDGVARAYQTSQSYRDAVAFFDRSLSTSGFRVANRAVTARATVWSLQGPGGERAHVAVRDTNPTTFETVEANRQATPPAPAPAPVPAPAPSTR